MNTYKKLSNLVKMTEKEAKDYLEDMIMEGQYEGDKIVERDDEEVIMVAIAALEEIKQYREIGTVEECREAMERQRGKEPLLALEKQKKAAYMHKCPKCGCAVGYVEKIPFRKRVLIEHTAPYCCICGQKLDWRD